MDLYELHCSFEYFPQHFTIPKEFSVPICFAHFLSHLCVPYKNSRISADLKFPTTSKYRWESGTPVFAAELRACFPNHLLSPTRINAAGCPQSPLPTLVVLNRRKPASGAEVTKGKVSEDVIRDFFERADTDRPAAPLWVGALFSFATFSDRSPMSTHGMCFGSLGAGARVLA